MTESHVAAGPRPLGAVPSDYAVLKRRIREAGLLKKEPAYKGTPGYAALNFGSAPDNRILFALDRPKEGDPVLYADANADGDLTNDPPVAWEKCSFKQAMPAARPGLFRRPWLKTRSP